MKTISEINYDFEKLQQTDRTKLTNREISQLQTEAIFLKNCKLYLENNPSEEAIRRDYENVKERITYINNPETYATWKKNMVISFGITDKELVKKYQDEMQRTKYLKQYKTLSYLLD